MSHLLEHELQFCHVMRVTVTYCTLGPTFFSNDCSSVPGVLVFYFYHLFRDNFKCSLLMSGVDNAVDVVHLEQ